MAKNNEITEKQKKFCQEYLKDNNGKQAAIRTGYSKKTAESQASRLLSNAKVQEYLGKKVEKIGFDSDKAVLETLNVLLGIITGTQKEPNNTESKNLVKVKASEVLLNKIPNKLIEKIQALDYEKKKFELEKLKNPENENTDIKVEVVWK